MTGVNARAAANGGVVAVVLALVVSIVLTSGRTEEERGLGYDGTVYAAMVVDSLQEGGANPRMRPLVLLTNQLAYDFVFQDPIRTFQAMNLLYWGLLALVLCGILGHYGVPLAHKFVFSLNVFATIAVVKMFAFYPVLLDVGAYFWVSLAVLAILRGGRLAIVACTVAAVFAREFGLVAVVFGMHRDLRQRVPLLRVVATYAPALAAFSALRLWVLSTTDPSLLGIDGGLLSTADVIANARLFVNPLFLTALAYFGVTVFGGISILLGVRALGGHIRLRGEWEWLTFLGLVGGLTLVGHADIWRYMAYALPAVAGLYALNLAREDWRVLAPWAATLTVITQQPWARMNDQTYFEDWFPLYLPLFSIPDGPTPQFWTAWAVRLAVVAVLCGTAWVLLRPARLLAGEAESQVAV